MCVCVEGYGGVKLGLGCAGQTETAERERSWQGYLSAGLNVRCLCMYSLCVVCPPGFRGLILLLIAVRDETEKTFKLSTHAGDQPESRWILYTGSF